MQYLKKKKRADRIFNFILYDKGESISFLEKKNTIVLLPIHVTVCVVIFLAFIFLFFVAYFM